MASALTQMLKDSQNPLPLMPAKIRFLDAKFSLVQIPRKELQSFLPSIFQLLFPDTRTNKSLDQTLHACGEHKETWANQHAFLNVSVNRLECSIICSTDRAKQYFSKATTITGSFPSETGANNRATVSVEEFLVISIEGEGLDASQRVLELTTPLALAGVSIFFITTYFSDYILVPLRCRPQVISALSDRGFTFDTRRETYFNPTSHSQHHHHRSNSSTVSFDPGSPPTPPPKTLTELQSRTFRRLRTRGIAPKVDPSLLLVRCAGRRDDLSSLARDELRLQHGLTKCLIHEPQFFSLTLTEDEPASLLLERQQLAHFGPPDALLGNKDDLMVPITLDLATLPFDATGIVCGLAQSLSGVAADRGPRLGAIDMSYLSTARAGTIIVDETDLVRALDALRVAETLVEETLEISRK